ncbi:hypothetical protein Mapa_003657 [Marchantia paleacea]|nr:hypothetical protein Mapa_003657 [Marchantia paleacea]
MALRVKVADAIHHAAEYLLAIQRPEQFWCAELEANSTLTSEYVMMCHILGIDHAETRRDKILRYFTERQNPEDGSWSIAYGVPGDISTTTEAYMALVILGVESYATVLRAAKSFILSKGGLAKVRIFTRINLALFGLLSWDSVPVLPAEIILLPTQLPVSLYSFASWTRSTLVPLFVISHHRPVYQLPSEHCYTLIDDLWLSHHGKVPYLPPLRQMLKKHGASWKTFFGLMEPMLRVYERFRPVTLRKHALTKCMDWMLDHQEEQGDTAGIIPPMLYGAIAMRLHGFSVDSKEVRGCIEAIERFGWETHGQYRLQSCVSPVWDTSLAATALLDCDWNPRDPRVEGAVRWMLDRQVLLDHGDWKMFRPHLAPGGWAFEYFNTWYPDVDDSAAVLLSLFKQDPAVVQSLNVQRALKWILGMQNRDGGWAAFDVDNDKVFLNDIPFSDMDALCDPSSPDLAGHVLEVLGHYLQLSEPYKYAKTHLPLRLEARTAIRLGIQYLRNSQEPQGSWYGRWGVNYLYGTSSSLCGLAAVAFPVSDAMVTRAVDWMKACQNADGGWGEGVESYADKSKMGTGIESTASQTAWALMGLLSYLPATDASIKRGVEWLAESLVRAADEPAASVEAFEGALEVRASSTSGGTWHERHFTGTGFPNHFYIKYHLYRHYFPMMALGRYMKALSPSPEPHDFKKFRHLSLQACSKPSS